MASNAQLNRFEAQWRPQINAYLERQLAPDVSQSRLRDAMAYSVNAGGKRLRPLLTVATLLTLGADFNDGWLRPICALELLHTYSLVHDDLPAMDDDDLRRGMPTNHVQFGAGMATLAGDGLLTLAFQWVVDNDLPAAQRVQLVDRLAKLAGPAGMVAGQADDIQFAGQQLSLARLQQLHQHKTGDLIQYAVAAGTIIKDDHRADEYLHRFAAAFGLAFQIYDDILDVTATSDQLGKPVHQDADKNTYPNLMGLDAAQQMLVETIAEGQSALAEMQHDLGIDGTLLAAFFAYFQV